MKLLFCLTNLILLFFNISLTRGDCSYGEFECSSTHCIPVVLLCDGDHDCPGGGDERNCRTEPVESNFLIVSDSARRNLYQVSLDEGNMVPILPIKPLEPIGVAYDPFTGFVYWTDAKQRAIGRYSLTATGLRAVSIVKQFGRTAVLDGLAIDAAHQDLYYCDAGDVGKIGVIKTDGQQDRELIQQVGMKPRSIVLDLDNRVMYWTDCGNRTSISRANMDDGTNRVELVTSAVLRLPNALAIDFATRTMFWGDAQTGGIIYANVDGTDKKLMYRYQGDLYYGIAVTPRFLYVTDFVRRAVRKLDRVTKTISSQPPAVFGRLTGIIYVADVRFNGTRPTGTIRQITRTMPISTSFPTRTSSIATEMFQDPAATISSAIITSSTLKADQLPSTNNVLFGVFSETTLITVVCIGVAGIVLIGLFCSLAVCATKKRSRSSSVRAGTINPGQQQQLAVSYTVPPAFQNNQTMQTTTYDSCETYESYDYIPDNHVYYLEPPTSSSSDGYMRPLYATGHRRQQSPPRPEGPYDKIPKTSFT